MWKTYSNHIFLAHKIDISSWFKKVADNIGRYNIL